jgi:hypothetical protein
MSTNSGPDTRHWKLQGGVIAYPCASPDCMEIASIVVRGVKGVETPLCPDDWRTIQRQGRGLVENVRLLERPSCFRPDCQDEAVAVMDDLDGSPLPVCQTHWDDLSWIDPFDPDGPPAERIRVVERRQP